MNRSNTEPLDHEFILIDRLDVIRKTVTKYGEENFYISFSGGKDSTVLSTLVDMALPNNTIPRVYSDTGIELNMIRDFVRELAKEDDRIKIITPSVPIKRQLEKDGYPFKSKQHSKWLNYYQTKGMYQAIHNYLGDDKRDKDLFGTCPKILKYQFEENFDLKISDKCCINMKENPLKMYAKENGKKYSIVGVMREEGGRRLKAQCLVFRGKKLWHFQPLAVISKDWEEWFIEKYNVKICDIYYPPYNFKRTGCKGCPFALNLQEELDTLEKYFPKERKQCEIIWKPVYDEYRRLGYRLKDKKTKQMSILDYLKE